MSDVVESNVFGEVASLDDIEGETFLAVGFSKEQLINFKNFIEEDDNRECHTGLFVFPSQNGQEYMVMVDSDLSHSWRQTMLPDILEYLSKEGIVVIWENSDVLY